MSDATNSRGQDAGDHWRQTCAFGDDATLYVLGELDGPRREKLVSHLAAGCRSCGIEVSTLRSAQARVDWAVAAADADCRGSALAAPASDLRARLRARLEAESGAAQGEQPAREWQSWTQEEAANDPLRIVRGDEQGWRETAFVGVEVKRLSVDASRRAVTMLVRMAAGSSYPAHVHGGREECLVLAGELDVDGELMRQGDYQVAEAGSRHGLQSTRTGCTLFIVSSQDDRMVDESRGS